jgi:pyruvate dehydrogenase E2 component (dihydrolipoamide acetyltransferase)
MPINITDARSLSDDGRGQPGQMAGQGRRQVSSGDVIAEIETDKATMEVEAVDEGTVGKIVVEAGTEGVKVNDLIAVLLEEGEDASGDRCVRRGVPMQRQGRLRPLPQCRAKASHPGWQCQAATGSDPGCKAADGGRIFASPLARRIAKQKRP